MGVGPRDYLLEGSASAPKSSWMALTGPGPRPLACYTIPFKSLVDLIYTVDNEVSNV